MPSRKASKKKAINGYTSGFRRHAKERCSQIVKGLDMDGEDVLHFLGWHTKVLGGHRLSPPPHQAAEEDANFLRGARRLWLNPAVMTELQVTC